jgi:hypothetical protein
LVSVARECRLELVFKLHPFESVKGHKRILSRLLPPAEAGEICVVAGPLSAEFWPHVSCALTAQSTVAIDCAERGIPIFLCGWLADGCAGYVQQYGRFGLGCLLDSPQELTRIPELLEKTERVANRYRETMDPETLRRILSERHSRAALMSA